MDQTRAWQEAACGLFEVRAGRVAAVNKRFADLLGYAPEELSGRPIEDLLPPSGRLFFEVSVLPTVALNGVVDELRVAFLCKNKKQVPVLFSARVRAEAGTVEGACLPVPKLDAYQANLLRSKAAAETALTENEPVRALSREVDRHAEELDRNVRALEAAAHDLEQVGRALYHSLREPVRKVSVLTDLLAAQADGRTRTMAANIKASMARMGKLLALLQDYLALIAPLETPSPVDLCKSAHAAAERVRRERPNKPFDFTCAALPTVEGSPAQLELMFWTLIDNSVVHARPGTRPAVAVHAEVIQHNAFRPEAQRYKYVDFARVVFQDNSKGLKASPRLFQILARPDPEHPGLGSGLARCRRVVDNHFGYIRLDEASVDGARFVILLPVRQST